MTEAGTIVDVQQVTSRAARALRAGFVELLRDAVANGASVGFLEPLPIDEAARYWDTVFAEVEAGSRLLFVVHGSRTLASALPSKNSSCTRQPVGRGSAHCS